MALPRAPQPPNAESSETIGVPSDAVTSSVMLSIFCGLLRMQMNLFPMLLSAVRTLLQPEPVQLWHCSGKLPTPSEPVGVAVSLNARTRCP